MLTLSDLAFIQEQKRTHSNISIWGEVGTFEHGCIFDQVVMYSDFDEDISHFLVIRCFLDRGDKLVN